MWRAGEGHGHPGGDAAARLAAQVGGAGGGDSGGVQPLVPRLPSPPAATGAARNGLQRARRAHRHHPAGARALHRRCLPPPPGPQCARRAVHAGLAPAPWVQRAGSTSPPLGSSPGLTRRVLGARRGGAAAPGADAGG
eukprot:941484-Prorocentrum_minimum.AAC.1